MSIKRILFYLLLSSVVSVYSGMAQSALADINDEDQYFTGVNYFNNKQYRASIYHLTNYLKSGETSFRQQARYLRLECSYHLSSPEFPKALTSFLGEQITPYYAKKAHLLGAAYYFNTRDFASVLEHYWQLDIDNEGKPDHFFYRGYANYMEGMSNLAIEDFEKVIFLRREFLNESSYYAGMISYENEDYDLAKQYLEQSAKDTAFSYESELTLAAIYMQEDNTSALDELISRIQKRDRKTEVFSLLVANYYYNKGVYKKADEYYSAYLDQVDKTTNKVYYRAGYSAKKMNNLDRASAYLKKAALTKDTVGQVASYQLGTIYLSQENFLFASNSFYQASKLDFDKAIQEEATFLAGKSDISADGYRNGIVQLKDYVTAYPKGKHVSEASELISYAYLRSSDYEGAIAYMEGLENKTAKVKEAYQDITLREGITRFNKSRFQEALTYFRKAENYPVQSNLSAKANFYMGETLSILKKYQQSIGFYQKALSLGGDLEKNDIYYGLGYSLYNDRQYAKAFAVLKEYRQKGKGSRYAEVLVRLGDLAYALKSYDKSIAYYDNALFQGYEKPDYLYYQKGLVSYYQSDQANAVKNYQQVLMNYANSTLLDDATFGLAQLYNENSEYDKAFIYYDRLIKRHDASPYVPNALLRRATLYGQKGNDDLAVTDFKKILFDFPTHKAASGALLGLQSSLVTLNRGNEFAAILDDYKTLNPNNDQLEQISFEAAKAFYFDQQYELAIKKLVKFREDYQASIRLPEASFFIGDAYYRLQQYDKAITELQQIEDSKDPGLTIRIKERLADMFFLTKLFKKAIDYHNELLSSATRAKDTLSAYEGLMKNYFELQSHSKTVDYANKMLSSERLPAYQKTRALMLGAKSYLNLGRESDAIDYLLEILNGQDDEKSAESKYILAEIKFKEKAYAESINLLYELNEKYPAEEEWSSKAYLLIAKNYIAMDELLQAKATLSSIIENSPFQKDREEAMIQVGKLDSIQRESVISETDSLKTTE